MGGVGALRRWAARAALAWLALAGPLACLETEPLDKHRCEDDEDCTLGHECVQGFCVVCREDSALDRCRAEEPEGGALTLSRRSGGALEQEGSQVTAGRWRAQGAALGADPGAASEVVLELNGDALPDRVSLARGVVEVWLGDGFGGLVLGSRLEAGASSVSVVDVDGDGALDLVVSGAEGVGLWLGDGRGGFRERR